MKRRKIKERDYFLKRRFPIFRWLECKVCGDEFRYEMGWELYRIYRLHLLETRGRTVYLCRNCAGTEDEVIQYMKKFPQALEPESWPPIPKFTDFEEFIQRTDIFLKKPQPLGDE